MVWSHPDMSLEDLLTLIKGFVDILILASGYQSTGLFAHWDSHNIKNAFQWATFFENVISRLRCLDDQQDSLKELDVALSEMKSSPLFPQGLEQLSSTTLGSARKFVLEHLIRAQPLREAHLRAFVTGTIELDLEDIHRTESDPLNIYLDELMLKSAMLDPASKGVPFMQESRTLYPEAVPNFTSECGSDGNLTMLTIHELMRRHLSVSCMSSFEKGLNVLSKTLTESNRSEIADMLVTKNIEPPAALVAEVQVIETDTWNTWRTKNMLYLLDKRTIRLVSGASMIFSAPRVQWLQVLERLDISGEGSDDIFIETVELLLLGCTADRWSALVDHFMSISYDPLTITRMYNDVHNLLLRRYPNIYADKEVLNLKEKGILEHLEVLLSSQVCQLWKLSPILAAISIPPWSELFRLYVTELESQFKEESFAIRCCKDGKEHKDCIQQVRLLRGFGAFTSFTSWVPMKILAVKADQYYAADVLLNRIQGDGKYDNNEFDNIKIQSHSPSNAMRGHSTGIIWLRCVGFCSSVSSESNNASGDCPWTKEKSPCFLMLMGNEDHS